MTKRSLQRGISRLLTGLWLVLAAVPFALAATEAKTLPEFRYGEAAAWLNSKPLSNADLRGKVVLVDLFTTG